MLAKDRVAMERLQGRRTMLLERIIQLGSEIDACRTRETGKRVELDRTLAELRSIDTDIEHEDAHGALAGADQ